MADGNGNSKGGVSLDVSVGKEIDRTIGEILTALLQPGATELGNLFGEAVGMLADRVRAKRQHNAELGLAQVRAKLQSADVAASDISSPKEEELHLLIEGLSLTDDPGVRDLWAGLFAKALEPDTGVVAERPFIAILQSLSPMDAKLLDFLAFASRTDRQMQHNQQRFSFDNPAKPSPEEEQERDRIMRSNLEIRGHAISQIRSKAERYGLHDPKEDGWSDNLIRQGIIERSHLERPHMSVPQIRAGDEREMIRLIDYLNKRVDLIDQVEKRRSSALKRLIAKGPPEAPVVLEVQFTSFGLRFASACGLLEERSSEPLR